MFATLWSSPIATNAEMGKKIAANFPAASLALTDIHTVRRTPQNGRRGGVEVGAKSKFPDVGSVARSEKAPHNGSSAPPGYSGALATFCRARLEDYAPVNLDAPNEPRLKPRPSCCMNSK